MFKHLIKLIWNKKKQNFLLISEILVSFMVIFAVFTFVVYAWNNYNQPMGFNYQNTWVINYSNTAVKGNSDSVALFYETVRSNLKAMPGVEALSFTSANIPFGQSTINGGMTYNGKPLGSVNQFLAEDSYQEVMGFTVLEGRWFNEQDGLPGTKVLVINQSLKEKAFGKTAAVGKYFTDHEGKNKVKVIGVINDMKFDGDYSRPEQAVFNRVDTAAFRWMGNILVKVSLKAGAAFESRLYKKTAGLLKNANVEIEHLSNKRSSTNKFTLVPLIILSIVAAFLIVNVALGLFGVIWYNINKRRGEIGLRRALGATGSAVSTQIVAESLLLATFSMLIGSFFAIQFPILNVFDLPAMVYIIALLMSILFIYVLVFICSLYPGRQAAAIYPAVALHEE